MAVVIRRKTAVKKTTFFTPLNFSQQVGLLMHKKGSVVRPHVHKIIRRKAAITQEVLYLKKGKIAVLLYDKNRRYLTKRILRSGDTIVLAHAAHGVKILQDSLILEVKQGPHTGSGGKKYITEQK